MKSFLNYFFKIFAFVIFNFTAVAQSRDDKNHPSTQPESPEINKNKNDTSTDKQNKINKQNIQESLPPLVTAVYKWGEPKVHAAGIGDIIVVKVKNLNSLLKKTQCYDNAGKQINVDCNAPKIRLFIEGRMMKALEPESGAPKEDEGELQFHLQRNSQNDEIWADILGSPGTDSNSFTRKAVEISVGLENGYAEQTMVTGSNKFSIQRIKKGWFIGCNLLFIVYLFFLISKAKKTTLLRDRGIDASLVGISRGNILGPYSLGRVQMAFWFTLVIASFLFIWLVTGAYDIITTGILTLIGISAGTSLSAVAIDSSKGQDLIAQVQKLNEEKSIIEKDLLILQNSLTSATLVAQSTIQSNINAKQARLEAIETEINNLKDQLKPSSSKGFLSDILGDTGGVSFHRLQMVIWTIVLGMIFLYSVWARLSMPEFSATLLALQGITAGTYLGFKFPEK